MYNKKLKKFDINYLCNDTKSNKISFDYILTYRLKTNQKLKVINK